MLLYAKTAETNNLQVLVEADIDTLAVQGPKSFDLMAKVFGEKIKKLSFFCFVFDFDGTNI